MTMTGFAITIFILYFVFTIEPLIKEIIKEMKKANELKEIEIDLLKSKK